MAELTFSDVDLLSPAFRANPYPTYALLQSQRPRLPNLGENFREWYFTRHDDVSFVLKDPRFVKEWQRISPPQEGALDESEASNERNPLYRMFDNWMLFRDPPDHTRLRSLVNQAFTPRMIDRLRPRISEIADELLQPMQGARSFDLIAEYAFPLPVIVIAEMLGVPTEDRAQFRTWSTAIASTLEFGDVGAETIEQGGMVAGQVLDYFRQLVQQRRRAPQQDMISGMIAAEEQGHKLSEDEMLATCVLLLFAGHETTVNLIGNAVSLLLAHPDAEQALRLEPSLLPTAIDECLRYESPVQLTSRFAAEDIMIGDDQIRRGDNISVWLGAANRDPEVFADPQRFDVRRQPNRHLAFAAGPHFCIGAPLARLEGELAIASLLHACPILAADYTQIEWRSSGVFRGPVTLPVRVG